MREDIKFPNPLIKEQRTLLFELAKFSKEQCLLEGHQRKLFFNCGRYDEWFDNSFGNLINALKDLNNECSESNNTYKSQIKEIIEKVEAVDTSYGGYLYSKVKKTKASPQDRLMCAEYLENKGKFEEALKIAKNLADEYPDNKTIEKMINRLSN